MEGYRPETYGDRIADVYDAMMADLPDPTDSVDRLADLAGPGPALELGIGTGRVALPLAARGVQVHGVDASEAMVGRLRAKPGGEAIPVTLGDFAGVPAEGDYRLVYVVFNTFFALLTQDAQVRCFAGVARRLAPGGAFVLQDFQHVVLAEGGVRLHPGADPLRLAVRAGPDGPAGRPAAARTLGRLAPGAVRRRQPPARVGLRARRGGRLVA
jgi:SAM-dependent methyltransferase